MPTRKYLRISRRAVLELRIYIDGADQSWFTRPMLEDAVRKLGPLVKPKLREERDKKRKKTATKDDIDGEGWRGSVFLVDGITQHVVLKARKQLNFKEKSRSGTGPVEPRILIEDEDDDAELPLFNDDNDDGDGDEDEDQERDVKAKPVLNATYDGYRIWGKAICLLVSSTAPAPQQLHEEEERAGSNTAAVAATRRRVPVSVRRETNTAAGRGSYAQMDRWLSSQLPPEEER